MALVTYSDSEGSDSEEQAPTTAPVASTNEPSTASADPKSSKPGPGFSSLVDRANPRKIRVALPEIKPETGVDAEGEDGPARKKPRTNGGGLFSGFNSMLPAPKRSSQQTAPDASNAGAPRKVFSLKTGAAPGFDRQADVRLRQEQASSQATSDDTIAKPESMRDDGAKDAQLLKEEDYKKKGNAMIFKPLSVARTAPKKKSIAMVAASKLPSAEKKIDSSTGTEMVPAPGDPLPAASNTAPPTKPKISLFSFSSEDKMTASRPAETATDSSAGYESLLYKPSNTGEVSVSQEGALPLDAYGQQAVGSSSAASGQPQQHPTLDTIADDLNLSRSQRRQLMGRNSQASLAKSRVRTFETDAEYAANQEMLNRTSQEEIAAQQHNPVRAIAPGKHSLQQLVQAASSQRDALEESFASGRRNKKEAGSKYGW